MTRRDAVVLAAAVALGLLLGLFAVTQRSELEVLRQWLSGRPQYGTQAATLQQEVAAEEAELQQQAVERARLLVQSGRLDDALRGLQDQIRKFQFEPRSLVGVEELALRIRLEPQSVAAALLARQSRASQPPEDAANAGALLANAPDGLGDPSSATHDHARAFVAALLIANGATELRMQVAPMLAEFVADDPQRLVGVLAAWASLRALVGEENILLQDRRIRRNVCVDLCQALLDAHRDAGAFADGLSEIATDGRRTPVDRALAAVALAEFVDLPLGLDLGLPIDDADTISYPVEQTVSAWKRVRELPPKQGFVARVAIAAESDAVGSGARVWLRRHVGQVGDWTSIVPRAQAIATGRADVIEELRALAPGADDNAAILARMEEDRDVRLPLHHLLTLTGSAGGQTPPRVAASTHSAALVSAWRELLGQANTPWTVRIARVHRGLDGSSIVAEALRTVRVGAPVTASWTESVPDDTNPDPTWTTPGSLSPPGPQAEVSEQLELALSWGENGATLEAVHIDFRIRHANGGSSSGTSGSSWPAGLPVAVAPWGGADDVSSRRAFLVIAQPGGAADEPWTIEDWRTAAAAAFAEIEGRAPPPPRSLGRDHHGLWMLGHTLALLQPEIDLDRLDELNRWKQGLGPGVARALALGGRRIFVQDTTGGLPTPSQGARSLPPRDVAELAVHAPDPEVRAAMSWLLTSGKPPKPVAEDLLALELSDPGRIDPDVLDRAEAALLEAREQRGSNVFRVLALVIWTLTSVLLLAAVLRRDRAHGARGSAALLLAISLVIAQLSIRIGGFDVTPAWAGWGLAALAVWLVSRVRAIREGRRAAVAFGAAALASAAAPVVGTAAEVVAALAAIAGCLLIAPLAPALVSGLVAPGVSSEPRKPARTTGWALFVRAGLGALFAAAVIGAGLSQGIEEAVEVGLFYLPFAFCFGGIVLWRLALSRDATARTYPLPFVVGLVAPALVLLVTELSARIRYGQPFELADPFGPLMRVSICCALLFVLLRTLDAARVRGRADQDAARGST